MLVGTASAGCVLAARLHAEPNRRVPLVEAWRDTPPGRLIGEKIADHLIARLSDAA